LHPPEQGSKPRRKLCAVEADDQKLTQVKCQTFLRVLRILCG